MGFFDNVTGHASNEADVFINTTTADDLITNLNNLSTKTMEESKTKVVSAVKQLNTVTGVEQYCGIVPEENFVKLFESMEDATSFVAKLVSDKKEDVLAYNDPNVSVLDRIFATSNMLKLKSAEGFLDFFDDVSDTVLALVGEFCTAGAYIFNRDSTPNVEKFWENLIKKDVSNIPIFANYYNSDRAKISWVTEDSDIAGCANLLGKSVPYVALAAFGGPLAMAAGGAVSGYGSGIENSLIAGNSLSDSKLNGVVSAIVTGATAGVGGAMGGKVLGNGAGKAVTSAVTGLFGGNAANMASDTILLDKNKAKQLATKKQASVADASTLMEPNQPGTTPITPEETPAAVETPVETTEEPKATETTPTDVKEEKTDKVEESKVDNDSRNYTSYNSDSYDDTPEYHVYGETKSSSNSTTTATIDDGITTVPVKKQETTTETPKQETPQENVITTPPSDNNQTQVVTPQPEQNQQTWQEPVQHTGVSYSESTGFVSDVENIETPEVEPELADVVEDTTTSIDDIIKGSKYTKIPTSTTPIQQTPKKSGGNAVIPIAAGLSAAAAAGIGAKAYMDRKHNSNNGEDDDFDSEEWSENDDIKLGDYEGDNSITIEDQPENDELPLDDDYTYEEETEKYGARNNEELADLQ